MSGIRPFRPVTTSHNQLFRNFCFRSFRIVTFDPEEAIETYTLDLCYADVSSNYNLTVLKL